MLCFCSFLPPIISHFCEPICFNRLFLWTFMCSHLLQVCFPCLIPALVHILDNARLRREHLGIVGLNPYQVPNEGPEIHDHQSLINLLQRKQIDKLTVYTIPISTKWSRKQSNKVVPMNDEASPKSHDHVLNHFTILRPKLHLPNYVTSSIFPLQINVMEHLATDSSNKPESRTMYANPVDSYSYRIWEIPYYTGKKLARIIGGEFLEEKEGAISKPFQRGF